MKYVLIFILFVAILFSFVITGLSYANILRLRDCINKQANLSAQEIENIKNRLDIYHQSCQKNRNHLLAMEKCYHQSERDLIIPIGWLMTAGRIARLNLPETRNLIREHNLYCPRYPVSDTYYQEKSIF